MILVTKFRIGRLPGFGEHAFIHIAKRDDFDRRNLNESQQIGFAVPPAADEANAKRFGVGEFIAVAAGCADREPRGRGAEKISAVHIAAPLVLTIKR